MEIKTNDDARLLFSLSGLTYRDLNIKNLQKLRSIINKNMINSELFKGTYRCKQRPEFQPNGNRFWAGIKCKSFYFDDREAISFNDDGFIGFAGWASTGNTKPILEGFRQWINEMIHR